MRINHQKPLNISILSKRLQGIVETLGKSRRDVKQHLVPVLVLGGAAGVPMTNKPFVPTSLKEQLWRRLCVGSTQQELQSVQLQPKQSAAGENLCGLAKSCWAPDSEIQMASGKRSILTAVRLAFACFFPGEQR